MYSNHIYLCSDNYRKYIRCKEHKKKICNIYDVMECVNYGDHINHKCQASIVARLRLLNP